MKLLLVIILFIYSGKRKATQKRAHIATPESDGGGERILRREKRIIGGRRIDEEVHWPWLVSLHGTVGSLAETTKTTCGAALVNRQWAITAAHCFDGHASLRNPSHWELRITAKEDPRPPQSLVFPRQTSLASFLRRILGNSRMDIGLVPDFELESAPEFAPPSSHPEPIFRAELTKIVRHPDYENEGFWNNDIALVKISESAPLQLESVSETRLPEQGGDGFLFHNQKCYVAGWGCEAQGGLQAPYPRQLEVPLLSYRDCERIYGDNKLGTTKLCAGYFHMGRGVCLGDSGGPLVCQNEARRWVQVGVVSFGRKDWSHHYPSVFTRVAMYRDWVGRTVGGVVTGGDQDGT